MYPVPMNYPDAQAREHIEAERRVDGAVPERPPQESQQRSGEGDAEASPPGAKERVAGMPLAHHIVGQGRQTFLPCRNDPADSWTCSG